LALIRHNPRKEIEIYRKEVALSKTARAAVSLKKRYVCFETSPAIQPSESSRQKFT
jgi:hypothetical protein